MVFRISEIYSSTQGEGPNVGKTTVFLRFGGCNLRCPGWPCDTQHAIDTKYRNDWRRLNVEELYLETSKIAKDAGAQNITLTGGEPFLQPTGELHDLVDYLWDAGYSVDCFSNGTIMYPRWAASAINFIVDWKLTGSGENQFGPLNQVRLRNLYMLNEYLANAEAHTYELDQFGPDTQQAVKFVIKDRADLDEAHGLWSLHIKDRLSRLEVFYGKVWDGELSDAELVEYVLNNQLPWRLNRQEHNYIWPVNERRR